MTDIMLANYEHSDVRVALFLSKLFLSLTFRVTV